MTTWSESVVKQTRSLAVCAGHSTDDPGVVANGTNEAEIVTVFRNIVVSKLHRRGVDALTDGTGEQNWPLEQAVKVAKHMDVAVEFHCNAASPGATGVETLSTPDDFDTGAKLTAAISECLGIPDRGAKPDDAGPHSRLAFAQAGGIIVELFFLTNDADLQRYRAKRGELADAVANVLAGVVTHADRA